MGRLAAGAGGDLRPLDTFLFGLTTWRWRQRDAPPHPVEGTVDVFITTYNERVEIVLETARAAPQIDHPHQTWILDDGARPELRAQAEAAGIGYVVRTEDWADRPRHAKAGNLNNALFQTTGEFLLILDADQIPDPAILRRTLGYFADPEVALVQTPQCEHELHLVADRVPARTVGAAGWSGHRRRPPEALPGRADRRSPAFVDDLTLVVVRRRPEGPAQPSGSGCSAAGTSVPSNRRQAP